MRPLTFLDSSSLVDSRVVAQLWYSVDSRIQLHHSGNMGGHAWVRLVAVEIFLAIADLAFSTFQEPLEKFVPSIRE